MRPALVAAIISIISAVAAAALYLSFNDWFGSGDLVAMFFWSLPLGALVWFAMRRAGPRFANRRPRAQSAALGAIGALTGFLWTFLAALILGGWIGAFIFPVLYCWTLGGLLGGLAAARVDREDVLGSRPTAP
jgi:peptidoglycan/LPS O-acetylase OafA/YrhL